MTLPKGAARSPGTPGALGAIVLAGGRARRFGGIDKTALPVGGVAVLDRVLAALTAAKVAEVVVVADPRPVPRPVRFVREVPPGGGPVGALAAGLAVLDADWTYLVAGDLPFLDSAALQALWDSLGSRDAVLEGARDGAVAVDDEGRDQPLLSCWRTAALRGALAGSPAERRLTALLRGIATVRVPLPGHPPRWWDCDDETSWRQAEEWTR